MMRRINRAALTSALIVSLSFVAACGGGGGGSSPPVVATPPVSMKLDVAPCLVQMVGSRTVGSLVLPDVITLDTNLPPGFPNGRLPDDPVIDLELAALFLELRTTPVDILAKRPLNPGGPDNPMLATFPWLAPANGGVPASTGGSGFVFRTNPASAYTRVDRMGEPAVGTVLVPSSKKNAFNDDSVSSDQSLKDLPTFVEGLTPLAEALKDDWEALNLKICAVPKA